MEVLVLMMCVYLTISVVGIILFSWWGWHSWDNMFNFKIDEEDIN